MDMVISELVEASGVAARTIREYIRIGLLPRPKGTGPAALYQREHLQRLWVIVAWRAEGIGLGGMKAALDKMTAREMARFKPRDEAAAGAATPTATSTATPTATPTPTPTATPTATPTSSATPTSAPASASRTSAADPEPPPDSAPRRRARLGSSSTHAHASSALESPDDAAGHALPGQRYALVPLLPGMILMVRDDAPTIVRRAALEIVERYGANGT